MNARFWLWPVMVVTLSACLPFQRQQVRTLGDLDASGIVMHPGSGVDTGRRQALERYREFLAANPGAPLEREAWRRIADLQLEIDNAGRGAENRSNAVKDDPSTPETDDPASAIRLYEDLLNTYQNQEGNDRILYQLARAYDDDGRQDEAYAMLGRLIADYPGSPFVVEAWFRRAELDFLRGDYAQAEPQYQAVLNFGDTTPFYRQARYKLGWSLFKQESYEPALAVFFAILDGKLGGSVAAAAPVDPSPADKELVGETLRVVSLAFSYLGGSTAIDDYFAKHPDVAYEDRVYTALATLFLEKERYFDAATVYRQFSDRQPMHPLAPAFLTKAIETYRQGRFQPQTLAAMIAFSETYDLDRTYWRLHRANAQPGTIDALKTTLAALARHFHAQAQKSATPADYVQAVAWYRRYLADFPAEPQARELHYRLAEALFDLHRYGEAAVAYERTAYDYPNHAWSGKAAEAAIAAFDRQTQAAAEPERAVWRLRGLASRLRLADRFPDHPLAAPGLARAAQDYFSLGDYAPASISAERLLQMRPPAASPLRKAAWLVRGHIDFDGHAYADAEKDYGEALALMPPEDAMRPEITDKLASAIYQQGDELRTAGDLAGAAGQFLRVASAVPGSSIVSSAEYDAAAALITLKQWPRAIEILESFRARFPDHALKDEVSIKLAAAYLENGRGADAAREFEHLGTLRGAPGFRSDALWRAAELYAAAGQANAAARVYKRYLDDFPGDFVQGMEARQRLAELNLAAGNTGRHLFWLKRVIEADEAAGVARTDRSRTLAAQAALVLARSAQQRFDKAALVLPLKKSLKTKKTLMEQTLAAYKRALTYGIAEVSTAATYDMAELYHAFSVALMKSQRPKGLGNDELEEYNLLLEEQAYPFEEDAIAIHEDNSRHANEGIYNEWVKASYKVLAKMLPVRYAKPERSEEFLDVVE